MRKAFIIAILLILSIFAFSCGLDKPYVHFISPEENTIIQPGDEVTIKWVANKTEPYFDLYFMTPNENDDNVEIGTFNSFDWESIKEGNIYTYTFTVPEKADDGVYDIYDSEGYAFKLKAYPLGEDPIELISGLVIVGERTEGFSWEKKSGKYLVQDKYGLAEVAATYKDEGKAFLYGGVNWNLQSDFARFFISEYDYNTDSITKLKNGDHLKEVMYASHTMTYIAPGQVVQFGGAAGLDFLEGTYLYNAGLKEWKKLEVVDEEPSPRILGCITYLSENQALLFGGIPEKGDPLKDTWKLDISSGKADWTLIDDGSDAGNSTPGAGSYARISYLNDGKVLMCGGADRNDDGYLSAINETWIYEDATESWTKLSLTSHGNVVYNSVSYAGEDAQGNGLVISYGGLEDDPSGESYYFNNALYIFRESDMMWEKVVLSTGPKGLLLDVGLTFIGGGKVLLVGGVDIFDETEGGSGTYNRDTYILHIDESVGNGYAPVEE